MNKSIPIFSDLSDNISAGLLPSSTLIMRLLSNCFGMFVLSSDKIVLYSQQYAFSGRLSLAEKFSEIENAYKKMGVVCGKNVFQFYTNINTQIPEELYVENLNTDIANLLISNSKEYIPVAEKIDKWQLYNLSLWNKDLREKVDDIFPNFQQKTVLGALLEKIAARPSKEEVIVFVETHNFTIIVKNTNGLLGCNSFAFETEADFLYYNLAFLRKFYQNISALPVFLCGNIVKDSSLFQSMNKYLPCVELAKSEAANSSIENAHYYFDII